MWNIISLPHSLIASLHPFGPGLLPTLSSAFATLSFLLSYCCWSCAPAATCQGKVLLRCTGSRGRPHGGHLYGGLHSSVLSSSGRGHASTARACCTHPAACASLQPAPVPVPLPRHRCRCLRQGKAAAGPLPVVGVAVVSGGPALGTAPAGAQVQRRHRLATSRPAGSPDFQRTERQHSSASQDAPFSAARQTCDPGSRAAVGWWARRPKCLFAV